MSFLLWQPIERHALATPERVAVRGDGASLTYGALWDASGRLAAWLVSQGIGRGARIGMLLPKSPECLVVMLGVLRSGAAYVPVDPRAPAARQAVVLGNADVAALIATPELLTALTDALSDWQPPRVVAHGSGALPTWCGVDVPQLMGLPDGTVDPARVGGHEGDPAYLLYTSGSTGVPKGVVLSHRNALSFVDWGIEAFGITASDVLSNHAPHHFDLSVFDIYAALHVGATVAIVPDRLAAFPTRLAEWIEREGITTWYSVPSALIRLLLHGRMERFTFPALRTVLFAGEPFAVKHLRDVMDRMPTTAFHNLFGPTETNVCTWYAVPRPLPDDIEQLPIGRVCANQAGTILTDDGREAAIGEDGELLIAGGTVMLGYWGLPERTAAVRVQHPLHTRYAEPVLRTGDRVRSLPDGTLIFLGRRDHMIKTRGYRVELGEVEHALLSHESVRGAGVVALPHPEFGHLLYAAVEGDDTLSHDLLVPVLLAKIARYAVPEQILVLPELPVSSTGKLDRTRLREIILSTLETR